MKYAIISGEYSDWILHGYVDTEEDAIAYCAVQNTEGNYDDYYYEGIDKLDVDAESVELYHAYEVNFMPHDDSVATIKSLGLVSKKGGEVFFCFDAVSILKPYSVVVNIREADTDLAQKVACDIAAEIRSFALQYVMDAKDLNNKEYKNYTIHINGNSPYRYY